MTHLAPQGLILLDRCSQRKGKIQQVEKVYIALFTCAASRMIHLELVHKKFQKVYVQKGHSEEGGFRQW